MMVWYLTLAPQMRMRRAALCTVSRRRGATAAHLVPVWRSALDPGSSTCVASRYGDSLEKLLQCSAVECWTG